MSIGNNQNPYGTTQSENSYITVGSKRLPIKVSVGYEDKSISENDMEMDIRARTAVRVAIEKSFLRKNPVARYDLENHKVYMEYPDGTKKYVD